MSWPHAFLARLRFVRSRGALVAALVAIAVVAGPSRVLGPAPKRLADLSVEFAFPDLERCTGGFCHAVGEGAFGVVFRGDIDGTKARAEKPGSGSSLSRQPFSGHLRLRRSRRGCGEAPPAGAGRRRVHPGGEGPKPLPAPEPRPPRTPAHPRSARVRLRNSTTEFKRFDSAIAE